MQIHDAVLSLTIGILEQGCKKLRPGGGPIPSVAVPSDGVFMDSAPDDAGGEGIPENRTSGLHIAAKPRVFGIRAVGQMSL